MRWCLGLFVLTTISVPVFAQRTTEEVLFALSIAEKAQRNDMPQLSLKLVVEALKFGPPMVSSTKPKDDFRNRGARVQLSAAPKVTTIEQCRRKINRTVTQLIAEWHKQRMTDDQLALFLEQLILPSARPDRACLYETHGSRWQDANLGIAELWFEFDRLPVELTERLNAKRGNSLSHACLSLLFGDRKIDQAAGSNSVDRHSHDTAMSAVVAHTKSGLTEQDAKIVAATAMVGHKLGPQRQAQLCQIAGLRLPQGQELLLQAARLFRRSADDDQFRVALRQYLELSVDLPAAQQVVREELRASGFSNAEIDSFASSETLPVARKVATLSLFDDLKNADPANIWLVEYIPKTQHIRLISELPQLTFAHCLDIHSPSQTAVFAATRPGKTVTSGQEIFTLSLQTGELQFIASGTLPAWSPNGQRCVFCRYRPAAGIWFYSKPNDRLTLVSSSGWAPAWSADGRIAWIESESKLPIRVYNLVENQLSAVDWVSSKPVHVASFNFTSNGDFLLATKSADTSSNSSVLEIDSTTGRETVLTKNVSQRDRLQHQSAGLFFVRKSSRFSVEQVYYQADGHQSAIKLPKQPSNRRNVSVSLAEDGRVYFFSLPAGQH